MSNISENVKTRKIEYTSEDLKKIEDAVGEIRSLAMTARSSTEKENRRCLQEITFQANSIINRLNNGLIMDEVELSR